MDIKIAPSILSADFGRLNEDIASIDQYADILHVDVMDGHFVPNISFGPVVIKDIKSDLPLDCHLMIQDPGKYVEAFVKAGASNITIHREVFDSEDEVKIVLDKIKDLGVKASICLNPDKELSLIENLLDEVDMVLFMSVFPGFGGQKFISEVLGKVKELRLMKPELDIEIDGGINGETVIAAKEAGANVIVAGSYVFGAEDRVKAILSLR